MRLIFIPFGLTNYLLGVTSVSFWRYMFASMTYIFKSSLYTCIGCTMYSVKFKNVEDKGTENTIFIIEIIFTILLTLIISSIAKKILER